MAMRGRWKKADALRALAFAAMLSLVGACAHAPAVKPECIDLPVHFAAVATAAQPLRATVRERRIGARLPWEERVQP